MALTNPCFKDQIGLICEERTRREERRGEEEKEEKRKKGDSSQEPSQKGMETTLSMDFVWITWNLRLDMVNLLSLNLGF